MPFHTSEKTRVAIAFALVYLLWGSTYCAIHIAGLQLAPPLVGATRSLLSTVIICAICLARGVSLRVPRRTAWRLALVGILMMTVNNLLLIWGETKVASGLASLIIAMIPIFVAVIETALPGGETLNLRGWLGTLLGAIGMFVLLWPALHRAGGAPDRRSLAGFLILIVAALAFAVGSVISRRFHFKVDTFVATAWQIGAAGVVNLTIATAGGASAPPTGRAPASSSILYLSTFGSVVGLTAYTYLLQHVPVTKVSTYAFVNPVIAVLIGVAALHERLAPAELAGMVIILISVATVILSRTKSAPPAHPTPCWKSPSKSEPRCPMITVDHEVIAPVSPPPDFTSASTAPRPSRPRSPHPSPQLRPNRIRPREVPRLLGRRPLRHQSLNRLVRKPHLRHQLRRSLADASLRLGPRQRRARQLRIAIHQHRKHAVEQRQHPQNLVRILLHPASPHPQPSSPPAPSR